MPRTLYGRYWDIHLTATDGTYDFARHIKTLATFQGTEKSRGLGNQLAVQRIFVRRERRKFSLTKVLTSLPVSNLPRDEGYVATAATLGSVKRSEVNPDVQQAVTWINDPRFRSKIRLNVHGSPGGKLEMGPDSDPDSSIDAKLVAFWLKANGLTPGGGLKTINVAACYSSLDENLIPNSLSNGKDTTSAIRQIASGLAESSVNRPAIHGIEVTGGNEPSTGNGFARDFFVPTGGGFAAPEKIPDGEMLKGKFRYDAFFFRLAIPPTWTIELNPAQVNKSILIAPANAQATPDPKNTNQGPNSGWTVAGAQFGRKSNWLVYPQSTPHPSQPQDVRVVVIPAPGWLPEMTPEFGRAFRSLRFIHAPGSSVPEPGQALLRTAQSTAKEKVTS